MAHLWTQASASGPEGIAAGISFFTFRYVNAASCIRQVAVYLSFFPHLLARPHRQASEFLPQTRQRDPRSGNGTCG